MEPAWTKDAEALADRLLEKCNFPPSGTLYACAVSGGADSLALLALATRAGLKVTCYHVDHQIRQESHLEADVVKKAAEFFGADFVSLQVAVGAGPNLEARARSLRKSVLPDDTATGHTLDDQAETVLINLLRGAGLSGLSGIKEGFSHPILAIRRFETRELVRLLSLDLVSDPSNEDPRFLRNRIRHELLPLCNDMASRDVSVLLARSAKVIATEDGFLETLSEQIKPDDVRDITNSQEVLAKRALRRWLRECDGEKHPPSYEHLERVLEVAHKKRLACQLPGGISIRRSQGLLKIIPPK